MANVVTETKSHQKFRSRIQYLRMHLQTVDIALQTTRRVVQDSQDKNTSLVGVLGFDAEKYNELNHPQSEKDRIINHSRARNSEYAVITLYSHFTEYLHSILKEIYNHKPLVVVGKAPSEYKLSYIELVKLGNFEAISEKMVTKVFRHLEEQRSTKKLLENLFARIIDIDETLKTNALRYLEMRHLFIHASGIADQEFIENYGKELSLKSGDKLPTTYDNARSAIEAVASLCQSIDQELIAKEITNTKKLEAKKAG